MNERTVITLNLTKAEVTGLRDIAREYGYILKRSQLAGEGSVRQMLISLYNKEIKLVPVCEVNGCDNQVAIKSSETTPNNVCWIHLHLVRSMKWHKSQARD